jgi:hypothetical protein
MRSRTTEQSGSVASCFSFSDISLSAATRNIRFARCQALLITFCMVAAIPNLHSDRGLRLDSPRKVSPVAKFEFGRRQS